MYIAYEISEEHLLVIALCLTLIFPIVQLVMLMFYGKTPLELLQLGKEDEALVLFSPQE